MKTLPGSLYPLAALCLLALGQAAQAQVLPNSLGFSIAGSFVNGTAESSNSILLTDNDLTNGYRSGFDLKDAPAPLATSGPAGSAAFQWGDPGTSSAYPHTSALWFQPLDPGIVAPEKSFEFGYMYFRNGTIKQNTGATGVELSMQIAFTEPLGMDPLSTIFGSALINTVNNSDPIKSADVVSMTDQIAPLEYFDTFGNRYYLELTFQVDQDTLDSTLSTQDQFRVFEGHQGRATLLGRFTVDPIGPEGDYLIPEPSTALLSLLGLLTVFRRKR